MRLFLAQLSVTLSSINIFETLSVQCTCYLKREVLSIVNGVVGRNERFWLKDRRERTLAPEDIRHYTRTCHALAATIEHMRHIDDVIEVHGGFPLVGSQP